MSIQERHRTQVSYGVETSYGEEAAAMDTWIGLVTDFSPGHASIINRIRAHGFDRGYAAQVLMGYDAAPSMNYIVQDGSFFKNCWGKCTDGGSDPDYTHLIEYLDSGKLPSMSFEEGRLATTDLGYKYLGTAVDTCELSWEEAGFLLANVSMVSQTPAEIASYSPSSLTHSTKIPFVASEHAFTINSVDYAEIISGSATITNALSALPRKDMYIGGLKSDVVGFELSLSLHFLSATLRSLFFTQTTANPFDCTFKFTRAATDYIEIQAFDCLMNLDAPMPAEGGLTQDVTLNPKDLKLDVHDDIAAY